MPLSFWRDLSLILLLLYGIVVVLVPLAAFYFANRGLHWFRVRVGIYLPLANRYVRQGRDITVKTCTRATEPLIEAQARLAGAGAIFGKLWQRQR
jgi:hypothetical protein